MVKIPLKYPDGNTHILVIDGYLKELLDGFKNAVLNHNTSVVMVTDGRSGMGKTTLFNQIGIYLDSNYNLSQVYYTPEEFLAGLSHAKPGSFHLFDEAMLISNRAAMSQINKMVIQAMSMIRSKRIYVGFAVNSIFDLDRNLAISRADVLFHVYGEHLYSRGSFTAFFKAKDGTDRLKMLYLLGKKYYDYSKPKANFFASFPSDFVLDEIKYEEQKQAGINRFLLGKTSEHGKTIESRNRMYCYLRYNMGLPTKKVMEISGLSMAQAYRIEEMIRNARENEENLSSLYSQIAITTTNEGQNYQGNVIQGIDASQDQNPGIKMVAGQN